MRLGERARVKGGGVVLGGDREATVRERAESVCSPLEVLGNGGWCRGRCVHCYQVQL